MNNKGNLNPDKLYSMMKHSHPAFIQRLDAVDNQVKKISGKDDTKEAYVEYATIFENSFVSKHG